MKTLNLLISISFCILSFVAGIFALILKRIDLGCLSGVLIILSYVAYKEFKDEV
jgi:hypothetical protein